MPASVLTCLEGACDGHPLFPNMVHLKLDMAVDANLVLFPMVFSPSLRHVEINFFAENSKRNQHTLASMASAVADTVFRSLPSYVPELSTLRAAGTLNDWPNIPPVILSINSFERFGRLREVEVMYGGIVLNYETLQSLSMLATLRVLEAEISLGDATGQLQFNGGFCKLRNIELGGTRQDLVRFFAATSLGHLKQLSLHIQDTPTEDSIRDALERICTKISRSLREAHLFITDEVIRRDPPLSASDILCPLLSFRALKELSVEFSHHIPHFAEGDVTAFTSAWTELNYFYLDVYHRTFNINEGAPGLPTVFTLIEFARRCRSLIILSLFALDVSRLPLPDTVPTLAQRALQHLYPRLVGGTKANLLHLAMIIDKLFPNVNAPSFNTVQTLRPEAFAQGAQDRREADDDEDPEMRDEAERWAWRITTTLVSAVQQGRRSGSGVLEAPSDTEDDLEVSSRSIFPQPCLSHIDDWRCSRPERLKHRFSFWGLAALKTQAAPPIGVVSSCFRYPTWSAVHVYEFLS